MRCENLEVWKKSSKSSIEIYNNFKTSKDLGIEISYIDKKIGLDWIKRLNEISKMITGLSKYHKTKVKK